VICHANANEVKDWQMQRAPLLLTSPCMVGVCCSLIGSKTELAMLAMQSRTLSVEPSRTNRTYMSREAGLRWPMHANSWRRRRKHAMYGKHAGAGA
jgi:hypothetical protein